MKGLKEFMFYWLICLLILIGLVTLVYNIVNYYFTLKIQNHAISKNTPTYFELKTFVWLDKTDKKPYIENEFMCEDFTKQFMLNFADKGFFSCETKVFFMSNKITHSMIAVRTSDKGIIYVEPQNDKIYTDMNDYDFENETLKSYTDCFKK